MSSQIFLEIVQLGTILIGFLGVALAIRRDRRQMHAQMYLEFSSRFHHILRALPMQIWAEHASNGGPLPPRNEELTRCSLQCFHIVSDLFHLHQGGYITPALWRQWQRAIRRAMQRPLLRREWLAVEANFDHDPELCHYMRRLVTESGAGAKHPRASRATA